MLALQDIAVLGPFILLLLGSIILSFKTRFIQIRAIPHMFRLLHKSFTSTEHSAYTIKAHKALFTAMSTTIGIGNIVGPLIAIEYGGPGALIGYLLATIFGSAATFVEVTFAQKFKDPAPLAERIGGPMHYMNKVFPYAVGYIYAASSILLMLSWSGTQSNTLAALLQPYGVAPGITGALLAILTVFVLVGGVKRVGDVAEKIVPFMFLLYTSAMLWIIACNITLLPGVFKLIWISAFSPEALKGGLMGASVWQALRWGLAKGCHSNEAGLGSATVPHSLAESSSAIDQGILSIVSVFSNGVLCILTGLTILITNTHMNYHVDSIGIITKLFAQYFPGIGPMILLMSATLFVISTLIGNSFNGSHFYRYVLGKRGIYLYYALCAFSIFACSLVSVEYIWERIDLLVVPIVVPHIIGLVILAFRYSNALHFQPKASK